MISEALSSIRDVEIFPIISLLLFFGAFLGIVIWVMRMKKSEVVRASRLPLDDSVIGENEGDEHNG